jgi:hypothetical protein
MKRYLFSVHTLAGLAKSGQGAEALYRKYIAKPNIFTKLSTISDIHGFPKVPNYEPKLREKTSATSERLVLVQTAEYRRAHMVHS